jgi:hypothetical protein
MRELVILIELAVVLLVVVWPCFRVLSRLGFSPWLALLMIVPIVNLIALWVFAYARWPALQEVKPGS